MTLSCQYPSRSATRTVAGASARIAPCPNTTCGPAGVEVNHV